MSKTRLIAKTEPSKEFIDDILQERFSNSADVPEDLNVTSQDIISYCARVSNPTNQSNFDTAGGLLRYCMDKQHWSIFEMVNVVIEINTSRTIARQILRHKSFSFQEFSQRYADPTNMEFLESETRFQDDKNRQNSFEIDTIQYASLIEGWKKWQQVVISGAKQAYRWAINQNIAKELSRDVLPEGLTPSRMYMQGSLRSWIHYCILRMGSGTQKEHREIAKECWEILKELYPFLKDYKWRKLELSDAEVDLLVDWINEIDSATTNKEVSNRLKSKLLTFIQERQS